MALDLRGGDIWVLNGREYPIRFCKTWKHLPGSTASFRRMCTETASSKRNPAVTGTGRGDPVALLSGIKCTPADPTDEGTDDVHTRSMTKGPYQLLSCLVDGGDTFYELFLEDIKKP